MKLTALCCTYLRPTLLEELIESFLRQDYPEARLVILDDAGQYETRDYGAYRVVSTSTRYPSLGEKRNACAALAPDADAYLVADDDDIYLPHWFSSVAAALQYEAWCKPAKVYSARNNKYVLKPAGGIYHSSWAYRRQAFEAVNGYRPMNAGEDSELSTRMAKKLGPPATVPEPYLIYRFQADPGYSATAMTTPKAYNAVCTRDVHPHTLKPGWRRDYLADLAQLA